MGKRKEWLISANKKIYNHNASFERNGFIDWEQKARFSIGDIVYIYVSKPEQRIAFVAQVDEINKKFEYCVDDKEFWFDETKYKEAQKGLYSRLVLLKKVYDKRLVLRELKQNGLNGAPQGPQRIYVPEKKNLQKYIHNIIGELNVDPSDDLRDTSNFYPETDFNTDCYEGHLEKVLVNRYERNRDAREQCIKFFGCQCAVCDMNFEDFYGELGRNFIHVHHIIPLHEIGKEYQVDHQRDLIPVCPNCHAMLHRGKIKPEKLRKSLLERKRLPRS